MKKNSKLTFGVFVSALSVGIATLGMTHSKANTNSIQELRTARPQVCYCVPAPGFDCYSPQTGLIYPDYKIVCIDDTETAENLVIR